jgi:hypothetical protein
VISPQRESAQVAPATNPAAAAPHGDASPARPRLSPPSTPPNRPDPRFSGRRSGSGANLHFSALLHKWLGTHAFVTLARRLVHGAQALEVALAGRADTFAVGLAQPVKTHRAHTVYRTTGWVRGNEPGATLCIRVRELAGKRVVRTSENCVAATSRWQRVSIAGDTVAAGHRLVESVYEFGAQRGDSFEVGGFRFGG